MPRPDSTLRDGGARSASERSSPPSITPVFPLLLLEAMRDQDRPEEVLEDEDLSTSLPRRLGLSDVIGVQIRRFQEEVKGKRLQSPPQVVDLMRLVLKRPDAAVIFAEAGRRVARHQWSQRSRALRGSLKVMPKPLRRVSAQRAARRLFRQISGDSRLSISRWPIEIRLADPLTTRADPNGSACSFYAGAFAELMELHTGRPHRVRHSECAARGAGECRWEVEVAG